MSSGKQDKPSNRKPKSSSKADRKAKPKKAPAPSSPPPSPAHEPRKRKTPIKASLPKSNSSNDSRREKRKKGFNEFNQKAFLAAYATCGNITDAADMVKIARCQHYIWMEQDPGYPKRLADALEQSNDYIESQIRKRAFERSDILLMFYAKAMMPDKYRDKPNSVNVNVEASAKAKSSSAKLPMNPTDALLKLAQRINQAQAASAKASASAKAKVDTDGGGGGEESSDHSEDAE